MLPFFAFHLIQSRITQLPFKDIRHVVKVTLPVYPVEGKRVLILLNIYSIQKTYLKGEEHVKD